MKLATHYNRVNLLTSLLALITTGVVYYLVINLILTRKLDHDLTVEENEIRHYTNTYQKLPLASTFIDQQVTYGKTITDTTNLRSFSNISYFNQAAKVTEPGRRLITTVNIHGTNILVTIIKSKVEAEELVRIILLITFSVTLCLIVALLLLNRLLLNRLWQPFHIILKRMKGFNVSKMDNISKVPTGIDEFNELNISVNAMAERARKDYKELKSFTDNASHEMMTPLAVINVKLDSLLQTGTFTEQQGLLLADIYHATGKLSKLHQSLLLLAKIENNLISDMQELNFRELIKGKLRQFNELFQKDQLQVNYDLSAKMLIMSRYLADILLNNLFSNAIRHNEKNGKIYISLTDHQLIFSNTGKNHTLDNNIFERFSKSDHSEGMGLGLAISMQVCNLYGFTMKYSREQNLHTFTILFNHNKLTSELLHN